MGRCWTGPLVDWAGPLDAGWAAGPACREMSLGSPREIKLRVFFRELGRELRENEGKLREKRERLVRTAAQGRECPRGAEGCGVV
ncbi:hypothetical protein CRG98_025819 [Punica granatum]|uniref:Uncharacterized protein n=1 Tax=Punica granatum TaxID=22663 RepID=A0A2I0JCT0_PUNGR|nr:hypothetical protein CRG98_025819 [Punica granatum]